MSFWIVGANQVNKNQPENEREKMMNVVKLACAAALMVLITVFFANTASATLITSLSGGTIVPMPNSNYLGADPQDFGTGVTWSSTNTDYQGGSVFGYQDGYGFSSNGYWDTSVMAGLNDSFDSSGIINYMTFSFNTPVAGVGGFMNYSPGSTPTVISVYDSTMSLIERATLNFTTGGADNTGLFLGFLENTASISYFRLTDNYIGITDLTVQPHMAVNFIPEPSTMILFIFGLLGAGFARRLYVSK
jgi:hypothetical protein